MSKINGTKDNQGDPSFNSTLDDIQVITDDIAYGTQLRINSRRGSMQNMNSISEEDLDEQDSPREPVSSSPSCRVTRVRFRNHQQIMSVPQKKSNGIEIKRSMSYAHPRVTILSPKSKSDRAINDVEQTTHEIYCNENNCNKNIKFGKTMPASEICQLAVYQHQQAESIYWQLYEYYPDYKIERPIEDHQIVLDICKSSSTAINHLLTLRLHEKKYDIIKRPADCLGPFFTQSDGSKNTEKLRQVLLMDIFNGGSHLLELQGNVHIKEGKKWKKVLAIMRKDGIYTCGKSDSKESASCYCRFAELDCFYGLNYKKHFGAPSNHCLVFIENLQNFNPKNFKSLCTNDAEKLFAWFSVFRVGKYGQQLKTNYTEMIQSSPEVMSQDFASTRSRCHTTSELPRSRSLSFLRGLSKRKDTVATTPSSPANDSPVLSGPLLHAPEPRARTGTMRFTRDKKGISVKDLSYDQPWFHTSISRIQAVDILTDKGTSDGLFLIRESTSTPGSLVLSLCHKKKVHHIQIVLDLRENAGDHLVPMEFGKSSSRIIGTPKLVKVPIETEADRINKIRSRAGSCPNREALKEKMASKVKITEKEVIIIYSLEDQYQFADLDQLIDHYRKTAGVLPTKLRKFVDRKKI
ncbi:Growth factor receptor-bound protein 14 [Trichoplax sp. H2]|nr:Growth factor receptor-bound protein 14 [Trichoplax sp. H2]|eukprot:RDD42812.1 Growth factor receptor-bound protein 14 [Trichoplax sp. H2]